MKAVLLIGGFSTQMRPLTLSHPLPLLEFCNQPLLMMQLQVLKDAGASQVILCYYEKHVPHGWVEEIERMEADLGIRIICCKEEVAGGTAGAIKNAQAYITDEGTSDAPFFVVNSDVLCTYPLRDLLHHHIKNGRECTLLCTRSNEPNAYGVVVADERTGRINHFVEKPETFVSDVINAGVYVFSPSMLSRIPADPHTSLNGVLKEMAREEQLQSMLLSGYWARAAAAPRPKRPVPRPHPLHRATRAPAAWQTKLVDKKSYMAGTAAHLEIMRFMSPASLTASADGYTIKVRHCVWRRALPASLRAPPLLRRHPT